MGGQSVFNYYNEDTNMNWGDSNIDSNPLFNNPENNDYTLQSNSPCIDVGNPESELDPDGTIADMGAYPFFHIFGCTDPEAQSNSYNPEANTDDGSCRYSYTIPLNFGANLISFWALPEDISIGNMMSSIDGYVTGVVGEGVAASPNPELGWVGSLSEIHSTSGYWVKVDEPCELQITDAIKLDADSTTYNLHFGANLISFPYKDSVGLADAIPDDVEEAFTGIIGEGVAAYPNPTLGWVGNLNQFEGTKGYWVKVDEAILFEFIIPDSRATEK